MPVPLLALALGGAALGALANPDDRKKGALMGLGAGLLAPVAAPMMGMGGVAAGAGTAGAAGAGGAITAAGGTAAAAPTAVIGASNAGANAAMLGGGTFAPIGAQAGLATPGAASVVTGGVPQAIQASLTDKIGLAAANTYEAGKVGLKKAGELATSEGAKDLAIGLAPQALASATQPKQQAPAPRSLAMQTQQGGGDSLYQRAAMNQQARMQKRQKGPKRFI